MQIAPVTPTARPRKVQVGKPAEPKAGKTVIKKIAGKPATKPAKAAKDPLVAKTAAPLGAPSPAKRKTVIRKAPALKATPADLTPMIAMAAYFMAEQRHFVPGHELQDWLAAEQLIRG